MKYKTLEIGGTYAVNGNEYTLASIRNYGTGLLHLCVRYTFTPKNDSLPELVAFRWHDGEIYQLKKSIEKTLIDLQPVMSNKRHSQTYHSETERYIATFSGFGMRREYVS